MFVHISPGKKHRFMFFKTVLSESGNFFVSFEIVNMNSRVIASKRSAFPCVSFLDGALLFLYALDFLPDEMYEYI